MSQFEARRFIIIWSIAITGAQMTFFLVAPSIGYPLPYAKTLQLLQIITPVFLGYLGSAAFFVFRTLPKEVPVRDGYLDLLVKGPLAVYTVSVIGALFAFGYSNRPGAPLNGMSPDNLATALSAALGVLAATTSVVSSFLFAARSGS